MEILNSPYNNDTYLIYQDLWFIQKNYQIIYIDTTSFEVVVNLYPFLENDECFYLSLIKDTQAINSFPYIDIIFSGLLQNTDFWVSRSVAWLYHKPSSDWGIFYNFLARIKDNKGFSQKTRQMVKKIITTIEKENYINKI